MQGHGHRTPPGAPAGRALACPRCGARLRIVRRRVVRRAAVPPPPPAPSPAAGRRPNGGVWWGALALLALALVVGEVFAAALPGPPPQGEPAPAVTYSVHRGDVAASVLAGVGASLVVNAPGQVTAVVLRGQKAATDGPVWAEVTLRDTRGAPLATGRAPLPPEGGPFAATVGLEPATTPLDQVALVEAVYRR